MNATALPLPLLASEPWAVYWDRANRALLDRGYARSSRRVYRRVVRGLAAWLSGRARTPGSGDTAAARLAGPAAVTAGDLREYLWSLADRHCSWSWIGMSISVLRTLFDEFGGATLTREFVTPRRPYHLPHTLSPDECGRLIRAGATFQERLAMSLLYGCGLKPGEVCALRAEDIDTERHALRMRQPASRLRPSSVAEPVRAWIFAGPTPVTARSPRSIPLPAAWSNWLCETAALSPPGAPVLSAGGGHGRSVRWLELVVRRAAARTDLVGGVSAMTLRHSYALHALEAGANVRAVQEALGHVRIETTLIYARLLSTKTISPLDRLLPKPNVPVEPDPPTNDALPTGDGTPPVRPCLWRPGRNALPALAAALIRFWRALRPAPS